MAERESLDKREQTDENPSPEERHEEFVRENGDWNRRVEEALSELDELASEPERASAADEPAAS
jgi:hypothetical protein